MSKSFKSAITFFAVPHPLKKFEPYVEKKGTVVDYLKSFGVINGLINYFNCRIRRGGLVTVYYNVQGNKCFIRSGSADVMVFEQVFLFNDYDIDFKSAPEYIVDAGAHIGLASLYLATRFPLAKIICLEPQSDNFELLCKNVNDLTNIRPVNSALWHVSGEIYLENPLANTWAYRVSEVQSQNAVQAIDIDSLINEYALPKIDLLKMDIEGSEKFLFEQNPSWTKHINYIVIEMHDHIQPGASTVVEKALAADMRLIHRQGENWVYGRKN